MNIQTKVGSFLYTVRDLTNDAIAETLIQELTKTSLDENTIRTVVQTVKGSTNATFDKSAAMIPKTF